MLSICHFEVIYCKIIVTTREKIRSTIPKNTATKATVMITTTVLLINCFRLGQVTFLNSALDSLIKFIIFRNKLFSFIKTPFSAIFSHSSESFVIYKAGPAGFEPATPGFGVRCSPVRATDLYFFL